MEPLNESATTTFTIGNPPRLIELRSDPRGALRPNAGFRRRPGIDPFLHSLVKTVAAYAHANRNVSTAAQELLVHPNTVPHRPRRVEELTGLDLWIVELESDEPDAQATQSTVTLLFNE